MMLELRDEQRELLQEVLDAAYRDLRYEIANTDLSSFKEKLRTRAEVMREVLELVGGPLADAAAS